MRRIKRFVSESRLRLNLSLAARESAYALIVCGGLALASALAFVLSGHRVQAVWLLPTTAAGLAVFAARMAFLSYSRRGAAAEADKIFGLKDALSSSLEFEGVTERNAFHSLQVESSAVLCGKASVSAITLKAPWRLYSAAALLFAATAFLCALKDSPKVAAKKALEAATLEKSSALKKAVKEEIEKMRKDLDPEEKKEFELSKLAKLAEAMKDTSDPREALRQYAEMQRELERLLDRDSLREDDKLLADIAKKLKEDSMTREMAGKLASGDMKSAAEELQKMSMDKAQSLDAAKANKERLERLLRHMEGMDREASRREGMKSKMKESMQSLSKSASGLQREMKKADKERAANGELSEGTCDKLSNEADKTNSDIESLARDMKSHGAKKSFLSKSESLASALMKAQKSMASGPPMQGNGASQAGNGPSSSPGVGESQAKGTGNGIGTAAAGNFDNNPTGASKDGYETALTGQKGSGDSAKSVESASSGSGKLSGAEREKDAEFRRQLESFVRREDVPDSMKGAVRIYFNSLHDDR